MCGAEGVFFSPFSHGAGSHLPHIETHRGEREILRCRGGETCPVDQLITRELQGPSVTTLVQGHASSNPSSLCTHFSAKSPGWSHAGQTGGAFRKLSGLAARPASCSPRNLMTHLEP